MVLESKPPPIHEIADPDDRLAALFKWLLDRSAEQEALSPEPERPPEPWVDKPGTLIAAEKEVFRGEMAIKLLRAMCADTARCERQRCRRRRRCEEVERLEAYMATCRAHLAAEQAKWQPPPAEALSPGRRRKGAHARRSNGGKSGGRPRS